ncbi:MAG: hypothetical protein ACR2N5_08025, partial [Solirubrobacterales bacterium]
MKRTRQRTASRALFVVVLALAAAVAGTALAGSGATTAGKAEKDAAKALKKSKKALKKAKKTSKQEGPKGDTGAQGPQGIQGEKGDAGATNVTERTGSGSGTVIPGAGGSDLAQCNAGEAAVGGGYTASGTTDGLRVTESMPDTIPPADWLVSFVNDSGASGNVSITAVVVC